MIRGTGGRGRPSFISINRDSPSVMSYTARLQLTAPRLLRHGVPSKAAPKKGPPWTTRFNKLFPWCLGSLCHADVTTVILIRRRKGGSVCAAPDYTVGMLKTQTRKRPISSRMS